MSARRAHEQSGFALIEVLISMIVASLLVAGGAVALVTGIKTAEKSSHDLRRGTALSGYADLIKGLPYYSCVKGVRPRDIANYYTTLVNGGAATQTTDPGLYYPPTTAYVPTNRWQPPYPLTPGNFSIVKIEIWDPLLMKYRPYANSGGCPAYSASRRAYDGGAQRVTIRVDWSGGTAAPVVTPSAFCEQAASSAVSSCEATFIKRRP